MGGGWIVEGRGSGGLREGVATDECLRVLEVDVRSANLSEVITGAMIGWSVAGGSGGPCGKLGAADSVATGHWCGREQDQRCYEWHVIDSVQDCRFLTRTFEKK